MYECRIEADSIAPAGKRIITWVVTYPRMIHSELLTHRLFSRNSSSSRAIPVEKLIAQVMSDPAMPVYWGSNQKGMQAAEELTGDALSKAKLLWLEARNKAVGFAESLRGPYVNLHKQIANRLLEPWMWITVIITATEWDNFFRLRCHPAAQPEIQKIAYMMRDAMDASTPVQRVEHFPFYKPDDGQLGHEIVPLVCVARCARVSYLTHDGVRDPQRDVELARDLAKNGHWSPFEHVAYASFSEGRSGNFIGWRQFRERMDENFLRIRGW